MKFLDTNITVDSFTNSLTKMAEKLPELLNDWPGIEEDLREEYLDQMSWLLNKAAEFIVISSNNKE